MKQGNVAFDLVSLSCVEMDIIRKLQGQVVFPVASSHKRFIRNLCPDSKLSARGRAYLAYIAFRYRRQWAATLEENQWIAEQKKY